MEILLEYKASKVKLDISKINDLKSLISIIKTTFKIPQNKQIEIYSLPKNTYLIESNFNDEFLKVKKSIKGIRIEEEIDLAEKIKNIGVPINKIEYSDDEEDPNNEAKSIILKKQQIFHGKCLLCNEAFTNIKYGCLLCSNYFLCNKCEESHPHPMIKIKNENLSDNVKKIIDMNLSQTYKEVAFHNILKSKYKLKEIYKLGLRTNIAINSFTMGNNQTREISLLIKNLNNFKIPKNVLNILIKNQYDLNIKINNEDLFKEINPQFEVPVKLTIKTNKKTLLQTYTLRIEVISNNMDIIATPMFLKVSVQNDEEDEALNQQFNEFPSIVLLPKERKKQLQYIIKEKISVKTPSEIKAIMEKFKWSIDDAISDLVV